MKEYITSAGWGDTTDIVTYKSINDSTLKLYIFKPKDWAKSDKRTALVCFHGGGWVRGGPGQFARKCYDWSQQGYLATTVRYRLKNPDKATPFECVKDGKSAIRYVRANAAELGIDPQRIAAAGSSAGGHVAVCTALIEDCDESTDDMSVSATPNALVLYNPVLDTTEKGYGAGKMKGKVTELSPCHHVTKNAPPTLLISGTDDNVTPIENAERFTRLMKENGNDITFVPIEGKGHRLASRGVAGAQCLEETALFLERIGLTPK